MLDRLRGGNRRSIIAQILNDFAGLDWQFLHVWQRDIAQPGWNGFEPGRSALAAFLAEKFAAALGADERVATIQQVAPSIQKFSKSSSMIPNRWWVATRVVQSVEEGWPGGVPPIHPQKT